MRTIDGKYYVLEDGDLRGCRRVQRERDGRRVLRGPCPMCRDTREHPKDPSLVVFPDEGWAYCHHCGRWAWTAAWYDREIAPKWKGGAAGSPAPQRKAIDTSLLRSDFPPEVVSYFEQERRLPMELVTRMGIKWIEKVIDGQRVPYIAYPTYDGDRCVNIHYRPLHKGQGFLQEAGCDPLPWNVNSVVGHTEMIVTEGRNDALACIAAGYEAVISLGNGAQSRMELFDAFRDTLFAAVRTVIIAVDDDEAGRQARERLVGYFGAARCKVVTWQGAKDANEVLQQGGADAVRRCIEAAEAAPIRGEVMAAQWEQGVREYWQMGAIPEGLSIDLPQLARLEKLEKGYLGVTSGFPGSGKSTFTLFKCLSLAVEHGWRVCLFTPEKFPYKLLFHELLMMLVGRPVTERHIDERTLSEAMRFLADHFHVIDHSLCKGIDEILDTARQYAQRYATDMTVIDPVNWVDQTQARGGDPMERANYIISQVVDFAQAENQLAWMVAHPRKPPTLRDGQHYVPEMWDIAGTSDYANKATWVEILQRDFVQKRTMVYVRKVRFSHLGEVGECCIRMNPDNHRFGGFSEVRTDAGAVVQYIPDTMDNSNWLTSKTIQRNIVWTK